MRRVNWCAPVLLMSTFTVACADVDDDEAIATSMRAGTIGDYQVWIPETATSTPKYLDVKSLEDSANAAARITDSYAAASQLIMFVDEDSIATPAADPACRLEPGPSGGLLLVEVDGTVLYTLAGNSIYDGEADLESGTAVERQLAFEVTAGMVVADDASNGQEPKAVATVSLEHVPPQQKLAIISVIDGNCLTGGPTAADRRPSN